VAKKNLKAKGQAFIVFDNVESAQRAVEEVDGFDLLGKTMVVDFAKTRSDATVMREGGPDELELHKRRRLAEKGKTFYDSTSFHRYIINLSMRGGGGERNKKKGGERRAFLI
jgi:RNA recognition motif-containing protein